MIKDNQIDFSSDNILNSIISSTMPMLVAQILNLLYSIVDRIYIGKIPGEESAALAGLGLCFPIITIITAFINLFGLGGAPLCAIERGKKDIKKAQNVMMNACFMLIITGLFLTVFCSAFKEPILYLFGAGSETYPYASSYIKIYTIGIVFQALSLGLNPYINSQGFAKVGMKTVMIGAFCNIILDPIFIFIFDLGIEGAAIATVISEALSAVWVIKFLVKKDTELRLSFKQFKLDIQCIKKIIALGIATFIMSVTNGMVQIAANSTLGVFGGDIYISIMTVINSIRSILEVPVLAFSDGVAPVISFNYGAKDYEKVKKSISYLTWITVIYTALLWGIVTIFPKVFVGIFTTDSDIFKYGVPCLRIYFFGFFMMAFQFIGQSIFKSLNKPKQAVFFSILRKAVIVVPLTFLLPHILKMGVYGVFLAEPVSNVIGGLACYLTMRFSVLRKLK